MAMTVVVAYDIELDRRRSRLAAHLQCFGDRVQKSVFLCLPEPSQLDALIVKASDMIDVDSDSIYILSQCATCWEGVITIG